MKKKATPFIKDVRRGITIGDIQHLAPQEEVHGRSIISFLASLLFVIDIRFQTRGRNLLSSGAPMRLN